MNSLNVPAATSALTPRKDEDLKDFNFLGCKVYLNWRGSKVKDCAFWTITSHGLGPFHPPVEVHVKQVRAMAAALIELENRLSGMFTPADQLNERKEAK